MWRSKHCLPLALSSHPNSSIGWATQRDKWIKQHNCKRIITWTWRLMNIAQSSLISVTHLCRKAIVWFTISLPVSVLRAVQRVCWFQWSLCSSKIITVIDKPKCLVLFHNHRVCTVSIRWWQYLNAAPGAFLQQTYVLKAKAEYPKGAFFTWTLWGYLDPQPVGTHSILTNTFL